MEGAVEGGALLSPGEPALFGDPVVSEDPAADCRSGVADDGRGAGRWADRTSGAPGVG